MHRSVAARHLVIRVAAASGLITLVVGVLPFIHFAYRSFTGHIALESIAAIIGYIAAYLALGRFRQSSALADLMLVLALSLLATANLFFSVIPAIVSRVRPDEFSLWGAMSLRILGGACLCAAAFIDAKMRDRDKALWWAWAAALGIPLVVASILWLGLELPPSIELGPPPELSARPRFTAASPVLIPQLIQLVFYSAAAVGFTLRAERTKDESWAWVGAACALGAWARVNFLLFPSLYTQWVYTGDLLRMGMYLMLLIGIGREIQRYWRGIAEVAVLEERRRMARDLHDGLAQDLAFIVAQTRRYQDGRDTRLSQVSSAGQRALAEAREAIRMLSPRSGVPPRAVFLRAAQDIEERSGVTVDLDFEGSQDFAPDVRQSLVRIMQEALNNACRHSGADRVRVCLSNDDVTRLTVSDRGSGFDPGRSWAGFGLVSMRERAQAIGGELRITSVPGEGTTVEVAVPSDA